MNDVFRLIVSLAIVVSCTASVPAQVPVDADVLLSSGTIYDGSGQAPVVGDVAIKGDKIVAVGKFTAGAVGRKIDCTRLAIAPGFIDLHNHSDSQMVDRKTRANVNFLTQGCTTIVTGNCGGGPIEVGEYYKKIDAAGAGTNVAHLLPQGNLRGSVIGSVQRAATADEIEKMKQLAAKAMEEGAWGMSTGLIYVPSSYADTAELIEIAKVVAAHGGLYASHIRGEGTDLLASIEEALEIGRKGGLPVHVSHFKASGKEAWGLIRQAAAMIEKARSGGMKVTADQYPYIASSTSLEAIVLPTWARAGGQKELVKRLDEPETAERIRKAIENYLEKADAGQRLRIARYSPRPQWAGKSVAEIAEADNHSPLEIILQITRNGGAAIVNFSMSEDDVRFAMAIPWVATASDGRAYLPGGDRPHPRSYGTFSRKIGLYGYREKVVSLEQAIRSSSALPAEILGLDDRGSLKSGQCADVVVFSPQDFIDTATFDDPHRYSAGVRFVFVNGETAIDNGTPTGTLAGKSLRRESKP